MNHIPLPRDDRHWLPVPLPWCVDCMTHRVRDYTAYWCVLCDPAPKPLRHETRMAHDPWPRPISTTAGEA